MEGLGSFDPPRAAGHSFETIKVTTTASVCTEDTFAVLDKQSRAAVAAAAPPGISVIHRHEEIIQVKEAVEAVRTASFTEAFDLSPRWDAAAAAAAAEKNDEIDDGDEVDETNTIAPSLELLEWKRRNEQDLESKHQDEKNRLGQIYEAAEDRKREFFARRDSEIEAMRKINREKEQLSLESREQFHARAPSNYWRAVSELILAKPAPGRTKIDAVAATKQTMLKPGKPTDLSRMRQIILKLKHSPPNAAPNEIFAAV